MFCFGFFISRQRREFFSNTWYAKLSKRLYLESRMKNTNNHYISVFVIMGVEFPKLKPPKHYNLLYVIILIKPTFFWFKTFLCGLLYMPFFCKIAIIIQLIKCRLKICTYVIPDRHNLHFVWNNAVLFNFVFGFHSGNECL